MALVFLCCHSVTLKIKIPYTSTTDTGQHPAEPRKINPSLVLVKINNKDVTGPEKTQERKKMFPKCTVQTEIGGQGGCVCDPSRGSLTGKGGETQPGGSLPTAGGEELTAQLRSQRPPGMPLTCPRGLSLSHIPSVLTESTLIWLSAATGTGEAVPLLRVRDVIAGSTPSLHPPAVPC